MKQHKFSFLFLCGVLGLLFPTACGSDSGANGDGDTGGSGDGDGDGDTGGSGDGDGDGDGDTGGSGDGDGDGDTGDGDGDGDTGGSGDGDGDGDGDTGGSGGEIGQGGGSGDGDGDGDVTECSGYADSCSKDGDCCSELCDETTDTCTCGPAGLTCLTGADCCSGQCNPLTNTCAQVLGTCAQAETPCADPSECCSLSCVDGMCSEDACTQDEAACEIDAECCSGNCVDDVCAPLHGLSCKTSGNFCEKSEDCCSSLCDTESNTCLIGASYCVQNDDICSNDTQCCSGYCVQGAEGTLGYCANHPVSSTRCSQDGGNGEKRSAGEVCEGEACTVCCSRTCAPYGPSGLSICQPPQGCKPDGELCRTSNDCCGGNPDGTLPGAGEAVCKKEHPDDEIGRCSVGGCNPHGSICSGEAQDTSTCGSTDNNAPNGEKCCGSEKLDKDILPCRVDALLIPRCNLLSECVDAGGECGTASDCCEGLPCVQADDGLFRCYEPPSGSCVPVAGPCSATADCCVGSMCILEPGEGTGVCGSTTTDPPGGTGGSDGGGGTGNGGAGNGGTGNGGAGNGGTGNGGTGTDSGGASSGTGGSSDLCAAFGQDCSEYSCCNGVPCDPTSNTCRFTSGG